MRTADSIQNYGADLYKRRGSRIILQWVDVCIGDWQPEANDCHLNVTTLCESCEEYSPVRGWLYQDLAGVMPYVSFLAHSAVKAPDGKLYEITPSAASQQYPFIIAEEGEEDYATLVEREGVGEIKYCK